MKFVINTCSLFIIHTVPYKMEAFSKIKRNSPSRPKNNQQQNIIQNIFNGQQQIQEIVKLSPSEEEQNINIERYYQNGLGDQPPNINGHHHINIKSINKSNSLFDKVGQYNITEKRTIYSRERVHKKSKQFTKLKERRTSIGSLALFQLYSEYPRGIESSTFANISNNNNNKATFNWKAIPGIDELQRSSVRLG